MWDLIVSVHDHCLSFYFGQHVYLTVEHIPVEVSKNYINDIQGYLILHTRGKTLVQTALLSN